MPVLTCPFTTIPAQTPAVLPAAGLSFATELTIKPSATETWAAEGLSFNFTVTYSTLAYVNIKKAYERQNQQYEAAGKEITNLKEQRTILQEQQANLGNVVAGRKEHYEKEPTGVTVAELEEARASLQANKREIEAVSKEIEGLEKDRKTYEYELNEYGKQVLREMIKAPPLTIIAFLYARGNELVWQQELSPIRFFVAGAFSEEATKTRKFGGTWEETLNVHVEFADPLGFTERENLRLVFQFRYPPKVTELEGGKEGLEAAFPEREGKAISAIQAGINYSRSVEGER